MGNKIGWIVAVVIALFIGTIIGTVVFNPSTSEPSEATAKRGRLDLHEVTASPSLVLGREMNQPGDAADDYAHAVTLAEKHEEALKQFSSDVYANPPQQTDAGNLAIAETISDAVAKGNFKRQMNYVSKYAPEPWISPEQKSTRDLGRLIRTIEALGHYKKEVLRDEAGAAEAFGRLFALGYHMAKDGGEVATAGKTTLLRMMEDGMQAQHDAVRQLIHFSDDDRQLARLKEFRADLMAQRNFFTVKFKASGPAGTGAIFSAQPNPGDVFNVIENDQDPRWRVQGILALGILRHIALPNRGDEKKINKLLEQYSKSDVPLEKAAAQAAANLTEDESRRINTSLYSTR